VIHDPLRKTCITHAGKYNAINQSLFDLVVIGAELGRDDHGSIPHNCDREGAGTT
jgi:hypothetical protein